MRDAMPGRLSFDRVAAIYDETRGLAPRARSAVLAVVKGAGHDWSHPGFHEKDLPGLLKPDFVMPVGPFRETFLADSILEELNGRTYSSQWDVPEEIHRGAMESLRTKWKGKEFQRSYTLEVTFWRSERLPQIAEAQRS